MKASEMIAKLQDIVYRLGDSEIVIAQFLHGAHMQCEIESVESLYEYQNRIARESGEEEFGIDGPSPLNGPVIFISEIQGPSHWQTNRKSPWE